MNGLLDFLRNLLNRFVDTFKMKNPVAFAIIQAVLLILFFGAGELLDATYTVGGEEVELLKDGVRQFVNSTRGVLVFILALIGAHTPEGARVIERS